MATTESYKKYMDCTKSECDKCTFCIKFKDGIKPKCFALCRNTENIICEFFKSDKDMRIELKRCYIRDKNPFYRNFNDYLEFLNVSLQTTFYDKYKDGYYGKKK